MDEDVQTLLVTEEMGRLLLAAARRRYVGSGGITVLPSPDGRTIAIGLRVRADGQLVEEGTFAARIMSSSGSFPTWTYTLQRVVRYDASLTGAARWVTDGVDFTATNRCEFGPASGYPYTHGTGVTVTASDGTVNSGSCKIKAIGAGDVPDVRADVDANGAVVYSFNVANSATA